MSNIAITIYTYTYIMSYAVPTRVILPQIVTGCDAVVSCLGHNLSVKGMFFPPRRLVTDAVKRLTQAIESTNKAESNNKPTKFILMGSDGVANPGEDDKRATSERAILTMLRYTIPPHKDNECAASYISKLDSPSIEWTVVRPTDLINGEATKYEVFTKPQKSLFGNVRDGITTRANVAKFMVDLIMTNDEGGLWGTWKGKMPVVHDMGDEVAVQ